jgi:hypothetical protein
MKVREVESKHRASISIKDENHGAVTPGPTETNTNNKQNSVNNDDSVQYSTVGSVGGIKNTIS